MNTNPQAIKILCYGDSNTWGYIPLSGERYSVDVRWTGILQTMQGNSFEIIEEGLNSRTTNADDPLYEGKNGKTYLLPCIQTHDPFEFIILFLGTNDLKVRFDRTPQNIADGIEELVNIIQKFNRDIKILLVCPSMVDESVAATQANYKGSQAKSLQLPALYEHIAKKYDASFLNLQELVQPSKKDGFHFEPEAHAVIAKAMARMIQANN